MARNDSLENRGNQLEDELSSLKQRTRRESERYSQEQDSLKEEAGTRDFMIRNQQAEIDALAYKLGESASQAARIESQLEEERTKSARVEAELAS